MTFLAERVGPAGGDPPSSKAQEAWVDAVAAADGLAVRAWRAGDRFRPLGLGGTKKLQDFFVDAKVPREGRGRVPLVVSGDHILWVVGHRIDEGAKVTDATRERIRITARGDPTASPGVGY
jgi:tRNA(Ile)-lysidine synthase